MSRYQDDDYPSRRDRDRGNRRRQSDDAWGAPMPEAPSWPSTTSAPRAPRPMMQGGPEMEAVVKWYNPTKGFGFVAPADGTPDVFMHAEALRSTGHAELPPGAKLRVRVAQGQKGPQVTEIIDVDLSTATPEQGGGFRSGPRPDRPDRFGGAPRGPRPDRFGGGGGGGGATGERQSGAVKWYNPTKGFGFIAPEGGGTDVFVHATALERAGLRDLAEGQVLSFVVETDPRSGKTKAIDLRVD